MTEFELHALIDGELASEELDLVLEAAGRCADTRAHLAQLQQLKDLVRNSYGSIGSDDTVKLKHSLWSRFHHIVKGPQVLEDRISSHTDKPRGLLLYAARRP